MVYKKPPETKLKSASGSFCASGYTKKKRRNRTPADSRQPGSCFTSVFEQFYCRVFFVTLVTPLPTSRGEICQNNRMTILDRIRSGWTLLKWIRVSLGGLILYSSLAEGQTGGIFFGAFFLLFGLLTDGVCCAGNACYPVSRPTNGKTDIENTDYEELGNK